jgi:predicted polyphosphate/ATP-dependent NAD kinase
VGGDGTVSEIAVGLCPVIGTEVGTPCWMPAVAMLVGIVMVIAVVLVAIWL